MATACRLVSLGSRVTHLTLLISVTWSRIHRQPDWSPSPHPAFGHPRRVLLDPPLTGQGSSGPGASPWGSRGGTQPSRPGTSPAAGAPCWRTSGTPASTCGRSEGEATGPGIRLPSHPTWPCSDPRLPPGAVPHSRPRGPSPEKTWGRLHLHDSPWGRVPPPPPKGSYFLAARKGPSTGALHSL